MYFRRTPYSMVCTAVANLIYEFCYGITAKCCTVLEECSKIVCNGFEVISLTGCVVSVFELVVAPAEC
ncbi:MAG: hypothetical protein K2H28_08650 [Ruminococcus sp.]|nr:hypothetical protein [Ruminococcus sp.]